MRPGKVCVHIALMAATTVLLSACSDMREPTGSGRGSGLEQVQTPLVAAAPGSEALGRAGSSADMPLGLRQATIAAMQQDAAAEYNFASGATGAGDALVAGNAAQRLRAEVNSAGVKIESVSGVVDGSAWHLELQLAAVGRGADLAPVAPAEEPSATSNRASLEHGQGIEEWYVNGPAGVEQGFVLQQRPASGSQAGASDLVLMIAVAGNLTPSLERGSESVVLRAPGGETVLRYSDLVARDATGERLDARMTVSGGSIALRVNDARASYPVEVDPLVWTQQKRLDASDADYGDGMGGAVAISGEIALVGARNEDGAGTNRGAAYVFQRDYPNAGDWGQRKRLIAPGNPADGDNFGSAVALDGDTAIVAAESTSSGGAYRGAAYVYERNLGGPDNWGYRASLLPGDGQSNDHFGSSVGLSGDTAVVGASGQAAGGIARGAAYVFERNYPALNGWGMRKKLIALDAANNDHFGISAGLFGDTAIVGAYLKDGVGTDSGAAYVFDRSSGGAENWGQSKKLIASDPAGGDQFGIGVAISGDTAIVGAWLENGLGVGRGAAYVFDRAFGGPSNWGQRAKLTAGNAEDNTMFGWAVALSGDTALVGAPIADSACTDCGVAYGFSRNLGGANNWGVQSELRATDAATSDYFGMSCAVEGSLAIVGAPGRDGVQIDSGAAYLLLLLLTNGEPCSNGPECVSGFCADGVCCDTACAGGVTDCQACSVAAGAATDGTCGPLTDGTTCDDGLFCTVVDACAGGTCTGTGDPCVGNVGDADNDCSESCDEDTDSCTAEDPSGSACDDGIYCNGVDTCLAGVCTPSTIDPCPGPNGNDNCAESCDESSASCTGNDPDGASCANDTKTCHGGACLAGPGTLCADGSECGSTYCVDGVCCDEATCAPYRCGPAGACGATCTANGDCVTGYRCSVDGQCISDAAAPGATDESGGCSCRLGSRSRSSNAWWLVPGALLALGIRGRRRVRSAGQ